MLGSPIYQSSILLTQKFLRLLLSSSIDIRRGADPSGRAFDNLALLQAETDWSHQLDEVMKFQDVILNKIGTSNFCNIASNRRYQLPSNIFLPPSVQWSPPHADVLLL